MHKIALLHEQVHANLERAQQRQKDAYGKRMKEKTKRYHITADSHYMRWNALINR